MGKKHEVLTTFRDKLTGDIVIAGSFFDANDNNRLEDMLNRGLLKEEKEEGQKEQKEQKEEEKEEEQKEQKEEEKEEEQKEQKEEEKEEETKETKEQPIKKANTRKKSGE